MEANWKYPAGSELAGWLNGEPGVWSLRRRFPKTDAVPGIDETPEPKAVARVCEVIRLLQENDRLTDEERMESWLATAPSLLQKALARYRFRATPIWNYDQRHTFVSLQALNTRLDEDIAIRRLMDLSALGLIRNLRCCLHCNKWFFAHHSAQKFCPGGKCADTHRKQSPEYKEYHRALMRRRYQVQKLLQKGKR